jgi:shikimate dehydrogenase
MTPDLRAVLFGHPVKHSRSPELFAALRRAGGHHVDFQLRDVPPDQLHEALRRLRQGEWDAAGITIPYKEQAANIADELTGVGALAGTVNAIAQRKGRLIGTNTDGPGFLRALEQLASGLDLKGLPVLILGAGGAARGVAAALKMTGAHITLVSRSPGRRASQLAHLAEDFVDWSPAALLPAARRARLIVQATPIGMSPNVDDCLPLPEGMFSHQPLAVDLIYTPWETTFLSAARAAGVHALNGWPMLVYQAAEALDFWLGRGAGDRLPTAVCAIETRDPTQATEPKTMNGGRRWVRQQADCSG